MRTPRDIEQMARDLRLAPSRDVDQRILAVAEAALNQTFQKRPVAKRPLWRIIMESPITKWAVAAALIVGLLFIAHRLHGEDQTGLKPKPENIVKKQDTQPNRKIQLAQEHQQAQTAFNRHNESALLALLQKGRDATQIQVAGYLGQIGGPVALKQLQTLAAREPNQTVQQAMRKAAVQIRQRLAVPEAKPQPPTPSTSKPVPEPNAPAEADVDNDREGILGLKVVDSDTGQPLVRCQVTVVSPGPLRNWRGGTDQSGRFNLDLRGKSLRWLVLTLTKTGYCPLEVTYQSRGGRHPWPRQHEIQMIPGVAVSGRVVNQDGEPMANFPLGFSIARTNFLSAHAYGQILLGWKYLTLRTDDRGFWHSREMLPSATTVFLKSRKRDFTIAKGLTTTLTDLRAGTHVLTVWPGITLTGSVTDEQSRPISDFKIDAFNLGNSTGVSPKVTTDPNGSFAIKHLNTGRWCVTVYAAGMAPARKIFTLSTDQAPLDFVLEPGYTASLQVVDSKGQPLANAMLYWILWPIQDRSGISPMSRAFTTDQKGWVMVEDLPKDQVLFRVQKHGYVTNKKVKLVARQRPYTVVLYKAGTLSGKVVDGTTGRPIPKFTVTEGTVQAVGDLPYWHNAPKPGADGQYLVDLDCWGKAIRTEEPRDLGIAGFDCWFWEWSSEKSWGEWNISLDEVREYHEVFIIRLDRCKKPYPRMV